jgi:hypothetical protein
VGPRPSLDAKAKEKFLPPTGIEPQSSSPLVLLNDDILK